MQIPNQKPAGVHVVSRAGRLARDIAFVSLGRYGQYVVTLVVLPILARNLGVSEFGRYSLVIAATFFGSAIVDLGLTPWMATRPLGLDPNTPNRLSFTSLRVAVLIAIIFLAFGAQFIESQFVQLVGLGFVVGGLSSVGDDWLLISTGRFASLAGAQVGARLLYVGAIIVLVPHHPSATFAAILLGTNNLLTGVLTLLLSASSAPWERPKAVMWRMLLRPASSLLPARFASAGYSQGPLLTFSALVSPIGFGVFAAADKLSRAAQSMSDAFSVAMVPRILRGSSEGPPSLKRILDGAFGAIALGLLTTTALVVAAEPAVTLLFGKSFEAAARLIQVQAFAFPAAAFTSYMTGTVLVSLNRTRAIFFISLVGITALGPAAVIASLSTLPLWRLSASVLIVEYSVAGAVAVYAARQVRSGRDALSRKPQR